MGLTTILAGFILSLVMALLLTRVAMEVGRHTGILDRPDGYRKMHKTAMPRVGGVAIYFAVIFPFFVLLCFFREIPITAVLTRNLYPVIICFVGAGMAVVLGLVDDIYDLTPMIKLGGQIIIAGFMYFVGFRIVAVINPLDGGNIFLGFMALPVTILWFLVCMNIVNLLDGIDGLAAGTCLFAGITLFFLSLHMGNNIGMFLMACYAGGILGFLFFNFPPARIFLGDSGSLVLGFFIASMTLLGGIRKADAAVALFIPVVALGLPLMDTSLAILRRWYKRLPISSSDKMHIHHRLAQGLGNRRALLTLYAICVFLLGAALLLMFGNDDIIILVIIMLVLLVFACFRFFSGLKVSDIISRITIVRDKKDQRAELMARVYRTIAMMESAGDNDSIWSLCKNLFGEMNMDKVTFSRDSADIYTFTKDTAAGSADEGEWMLELPLRIGDGTPCKIRFVIKLSKARPCAVDSEMLMVLCGGLEKYFAGIPLNKEGHVQG